MIVTVEQKKAALGLMIALTEAIRAKGDDGMPSGELYAVCMGKIDIHTYNTIIESIKRTGLVTESAHLLRWVGPKL